MEGPMVVSFVRVRGQRDRIYVHRSDGSEASWVFPTYGDGLPHDLVHLVVEAAFGVREGFWGRVDAGVDPARLNEEANRAGGADKYRGFGEDLGELLVAEGLAAAPWFDPDVSDERRVEAIVENCGRFGVPVPRAVVAERVREVRSVLERLRAQWKAFGDKGTIRLEFLARDPGRGFDAMLAGPAP